MIDTFFNALFLTGALYGAIGLVAAWMIPSLSNTKLFGKWILLGGGNPSKANKSFSSLYFIFFSCYFLLPTGDGATWRIAFAAAIFASVACLLFLRVRRHDRA